VSNDTTSDRKSLIIQEATKLFAHDGFDVVTVKRIAKASGITEPAVYRYFESKEAIFDAALNSIDMRLDYSATFGKLRNERDIEKLLHVLSTHIVEFFLRMLTYIGCCSFRPSAVTLEPIEPIISFGELTRSFLKVSLIDFARRA